MGLTAAADREAKFGKAAWAGSWAAARLQWPK